MSAFKLETLSDGRLHIHLPGDFIITCDGSNGVECPLIVKTGQDVVYNPLHGNMNTASLGGANGVQVNLGSGAVRIENADYTP